MKLEREWRELYRSEDPRIARMVATSIEAMEFDCRLHSSGDPEWLEPEFPTPPPRGATFFIEVNESDWPALREVLDEIIDEQLEWDDFVDTWRHRASERERKALLALVVIVGVLAAVKAIDL